MIKSINLRIVLCAMVYALSCNLNPYEGFSQKVDSTQVGKKYPYLFPFMGKKAYEKGYRIQLPHGIMVNTLFNQQGIILNNLQLALTQPGEDPNFETLQPVADQVVFGPSEGRINTLNFRFDTWVLPFLQVAGFYGKVYGKQTVTLTAPIELYTKTDIDGQYYGLNLLGVVPLGVVNLAADYSWAWTTNVRLDKPVLVTVSGMRVIYRIPSKNPDRFLSVYGGAQFQKLENNTSGKIGLSEALSLDGSALDALDSRLDNLNNSIADLETAWTDYMMSPEWDALGPLEKQKQETTYNVVHGMATAIEGAGESASDMLRGLSETTVHYKFNKRLEYEWNMLLGANYQLNPNWHFRTEYGFLKSKQQLMVSVNYRFGL